MKPSESKYGMENIDLMGKLIRLRLNIIKKRKKTIYGA